MKNSRLFQLYLINGSRTRSGKRVQDPVQGTGPRPGPGNGSKTRSGKWVQDPVQEAGQGDRPSLVFFV